jgi:hypothetical protein
VAKDLPVADLKGQLMAAIEQQDDAKVNTDGMLMLCCCTLRLSN